MSAKSRGMAAERRCRKHLLTMGYGYAVMAKGSLGIADVAAMRAEIVDCPQCGCHIPVCGVELVAVRSGKAPWHSPQERADLVAAAAAVNARPNEWLLRARGRGRKSLVEWRRVEG